MSGDNSFLRVEVWTEQSNISLEKVKVGQFVIVIAMYDCDWYRGNEMKIALHDEDVQLDFLALMGPAQSISGPENSVVPMDNIIMENWWFDMFSRQNI